MFELIERKIRRFKMRELELHFLIEDLYKEILIESNQKRVIKIMQESLNKHVEERENLYIYPEKVNV